MAQEQAARRASRIVPVDERTDTPDKPAPGIGQARRFHPFVWADMVLAAFWNHPLLFGALAILAVVSGVWGFVEFYGPQYSQVPWYLWPFVPDSPLAVTAWLIAAFAVKLGWDARPGATGTFWALFANWAIVWNAKIGIWTAFVLLHYADIFFAGSAGHRIFQGVLLLAHLGMVGYALLLFRKVRALPALGYVGILGIVFLWDFMDYFLVSLFMPETMIQVFPWGIPAEPERLRTTALVAITLSFTMTLALAVGIRIRGAPSTR